MQALNSQPNGMEMAIIEDSNNLDQIFATRHYSYLTRGCSNPDGEEKLAEIIKKYIESGGNLEKKFIKDVFISAINRCDNPSFFGATVENNPVIKLLIDKINLDIKLDSPPGEKLIHLASRLGKTKIVAALLDRGVGIDEKTEIDKTPLHLAIELGREETIKLLIDRGANLDAKTIEGKTPLHLASESGNLSLVKKLFEAGADINAKTLEGDTPLHLALKIGQSSDINPEYSEYINSEYSEYIANRRREMVQLLLKMRANPHETNNDDISASTIIKNLQTQRGELIFGASEVHPASLGARRSSDRDESVVEEIRVSISLLRLSEEPLPSSPPASLGAKKSPDQVGSVVEGSKDESWVLIDDLCLSDSPPASLGARRSPDRVESVVEGSRNAETKKQRI